MYTHFAFHATGVAGILCQTMERLAKDIEFSPLRRRLLRMPLELGAAAAGLALLRQDSFAAAHPPVKITAVETWVLSCDSLFVAIRTASSTGSWCSRSSPTRSDSPSTCGIT